MQGSMVAPVSCGVRGWRTFFAILLWALLVVAGNAQGLLPWGSSKHGLLAIPKRVPGIIDISFGARHALALRADGTVIAWGVDDPIWDVDSQEYYMENDYGQRKVPAGLTGVVQVAAGAFHSLALKSDGTVVGWGGYLDDTAPPNGLKNVIQIAAGDDFSVALKSDGTVVQWGESAWDAPEQLSGVVQIAAGWSHVLALKSDGTVVAWGSNDYYWYNSEYDEGLIYAGQAKVPDGLAHVVQIVAGPYHSIALKSNGTVIGWGLNQHKQARAPEGLKGVVQIAAGLHHSLALKEDGSVVAWGDSAFAALPKELGVVARIIGGSSCSIALGPVSLTFPERTVSPSGLALGIVTLPIAPGVGGADVILSANKKGLKIPASVHVNEGEHTATFELPPAPRAQDTPVRVTASYRDGTSSSVVTVIGKNPQLILNRKDIVGGSSDKINVTVRLPEVTNSAVTLRLKSDDGAITVPSQVTVPAGADRVSVEATHTFIDTTPRTAKITLLRGSEELATLPITIQPIKCWMTPDALNGGGYTWGQPNPIKGGRASIEFSVPIQATKIRLYSSLTSVLKVPDTVDIPKGQSSVDFLLNSGIVDKETAVTITAKIGTISFTKTINVKPLPEFSFRSAFPTEMFGNQTLRPVFNLPVDDYFVVTSTSSDPASLKVDAYTEVYTEEWDSGDYIDNYLRLEAMDVTKPKKVKVTATFGNKTITNEVLVRPNVPVSCKASATQIQGGNSFKVTVRLAAKVGVDTPVDVKVSSKLLSAPDKVWVEGESGDGTDANDYEQYDTVTFTVKTSKVSVSTLASLTITRHGIGKTLHLLLVP